MACLRTKISVPVMSSWYHCLNKSHRKQKCHLWTCFSFFDECAGGPLQEIAVGEKRQICIDEGYNVNERTFGLDTILVKLNFSRTRLTLK